MLHAFFFCTPTVHYISLYQVFSKTSIKPPLLAHLGQWTLVFFCFWFTCLGGIVLCVGVLLFSFFSFVFPFPCSFPRIRLRPTFVVLLSSLFFFFLFCHSCRRGVRCLPWSFVPPPICIFSPIPIFPAVCWGYTLKYPPNKTSNHFMWPSLPLKSPVNTSLSSQLWQSRVYFWSFLTLFWVVGLLLTLPHNPR